MLRWSPKIRRIIPNFEEDLVIWERMIHEPKEEILTTKGAESRI